MPIEFHRDGPWELPKGWVWARLGDVSRHPGRIDPARQMTGSFRYIDLSAIEEGKVAQPQNLSVADAPSRARQPIQSDDTLLSCVRVYLRNNAIVPNELDGSVASTAFCVLRPSEAIEPHYLFWFVHSRKFTEILIPLQRGNSPPAVLDDDVRDQLVPVPPLSLKTSRRLHDLTITGAPTNSSVFARDINRSPARIRSSSSICASAGSVLLSVSLNSSQVTALILTIPVSPSFGGRPSALMFRPASMPKRKSPSCPQAQVLGIVGSLISSLGGIRFNRRRFPRASSRSRSRRAFVSQTVPLSFDLSCSRQSRVSPPVTAALSSARRQVLRSSRARARVELAVGDFGEQFVDARHDAALFG